MQNKDRDRELQKRYLKPLNPSNSREQSPLLEKVKSPLPRGSKLLAQNNQEGGYIPSMIKKRTDRPLQQSLNFNSHAPHKQNQISQGGASILGMDNLKPAAPK